MLFLTMIQAPCLGSHEGESFSESAGSTWPNVLSDLPHTFGPLTGAAQRENMRSLLVPPSQSSIPKKSRIL